MPTIVTRHVAGLVRHDGVWLLTRTTRRIDLTASGRFYRERTVQVVALLAQTDISSSARHAGLSGPLTVSEPLSFGFRSPPRIMIRFRIPHAPLR